MDRSHGYIDATNVATYIVTVVVEVMVTIVISIEQRAEGTLLYINLTPAKRSVGL